MRYPAAQYNSHEILGAGVMAKTALRGAEEVVSAIRALPAHAALAVAYDLFSDDDVTLQAVGEAVFRDRPEIMASGVAFATFTGETTELIERLGDSPPWGTIRQALIDVRKRYPRRQRGKNR